MILDTVIALLGPVLAFFSVSPSSYAFIVLLDVSICGLGGVLGVRLIVVAFGRAPAGVN